MRTTIQIIETIKNIENISSDYALANILKITQSTISSWKQRGTIPYKTLLTYCEERGYILNTLLTGEGNLYKERPLSDIEKDNLLKEAEITHNREIIKNLKNELKELKLSLKKIINV